MILAQVVAVAARARVWLFCWAVAAFCITRPIDPAMLAAATATENGTDIPITKRSVLSAPWAGIAAPA